LPIGDRSGLRRPRREGLPLVNAGLIGVQDQGKYLRTTPLTDVENFAGYFLNPILVRDAEFLGIYDALGVPQATVDSLKTGRVDILKVINLDDIPTPGAHHVPIAPGFTGDVLRVDIATDSGFPNGRPLIGGSAPNREQADVSDVLISLILSGLTLPLGDGVNHNDRTTHPVPVPRGAAPGPVRRPRRSGPVERTLHSYQRPPPEPVAEAVRYTARFDSRGDFA
jgi:hypothetical protein